MCIQDCEFCPTTVEADSIQSVKEWAKNHLNTEHREEFAEVFTEEFAGEPCRDSCGYTYPVDVEKVAGFDCPDCGHDHFDSFATQYLYWQIELE